MASPYSNPIASGIDAFAKVSNILDQRDAANRAAEEAPLKKQILAEQAADAKIQSERNRLQLDQDRKKNEEWERTLGKQHNVEEWQNAAVHMTTAQSKLDAARKTGGKVQFSPEERAAILKFGDKSVIDVENPDESMAAINTVRSFMAANKDALATGGTVDLEKYPEVGDAFNKVFQSQINKGGARDGIMDGVEKRVARVIIDPKDRTMVPVLKVKAPIKEGTLIPQKPSSNPVYLPTRGAPNGMVEQGNIDLSQRKARRNADGTISAIRSMPINEDGKEVLIPMIDEDTGAVMDQKQAVEKYRKTGEHLGKFDSAENATAYGQDVLSPYMATRFQGADKSASIKKDPATGAAYEEYETPMTVGRDGSPDAQVLKVPVLMADAYLGAHERLGAAIQTLKAQSDPKEWLKEQEAIKKAKVSQQAITAGMDAAAKTKGTAKDQRIAFVRTVTQMDPNADITKLDDLAQKVIVGDAKAGSEVGKLQEDYARVVAESGADSPEAKQLKTALDASAGAAAAKDKEDVWIYKYDKAKKTYDERKISITKGSGKTELPEGWSTEKTAQLEANREKAELDRAEREARAKDRAEGKEKDLRSEIDKLPKAAIAHGVPGWQQKVVTEKAAKLIRANGKLSSVEAIAQAKKDADASGEGRKPIDKLTYQKFLDKVKGQKLATPEERLRAMKKQFDGSGYELPDELKALK